MFFLSPHNSIRIFFLYILTIIINIIPKFEVRKQDTKIWFESVRSEYGYLFFGTFPTILVKEDFQFDLTTYSLNTLYILVLLLSLE